jgi:hypothetical protein
MGIRFSGLVLSSLVLAVTLSAPSLAAADTDAAQAAFDKANAAFRNQDYAGALAGYNEALNLGKDSARLFYNMGLAHYRLEQYSQARWAFTEAAKDDSLAALAYYQLGVLANRDGDKQAAEEWFKRSRAKADSPKLRLMAAEALETIGASLPRFEASLAAGIGYDSNAFRTPSDPYVDLSQDPPVAVVPVVQSGAYVPVRIGARYLNPISERSTFIASYRHRGYYYQSSELENADETDHRLMFEMERALGDGESSSQQFSYAAVIRSHGETNFDRDDGLDRFDDGESIADRYDYNGIGVEAELRNRIGRARYEIYGGYAIRDYEDTPTASSYDLTDSWLRGTLKFPLARSTRLELAYSYRLRLFDERRSRDEDGDSSSANPTLEYQYGTLDIGVRHRFSDTFVAELVYSRTDREDRFVGYNNYTRDKISLETTFELTDSLVAQVDVSYRDQQYPNAFAFNNPTQAAKEYQELEAEVSARYRFTEQLSLRLDVEHEDVESSDPRGAYDRLRTSLSVYWEF